MPEKCHGQSSLIGYSLWGHKEWDTTKRFSSRLSIARTHTGLSAVSGASPAAQRWNCRSRRLLWNKCPQSRVCALLRLAGATGDLGHFIEPQFLTTEQQHNSWLACHTGGLWRWKGLAPMTEALRGPFCLGHGGRDHIGLPTTAPSPSTEAGLMAGFLPPPELSSHPSLINSHF